MNKKNKNQHIFFIFGGVLRIGRIYKDPMLNFSEMFANTDSAKDISKPWKILL